MKVVSVVGARPNFVKLSALEPLIRERWEHLIVHTGQHYDYELSKVFFENLEIPAPDYYLGVGSGSHAYQVGEAMKGIELLLMREKPDLVIVYGDTNSTLAGALAAVKAGFRTAHVEAGLRSWDMSMPEEVNRRIVDHISWLLFAPTPSAMRNLESEKVPGLSFFTGDVHVDVLNRWLPKARRSDILERLKASPGYLLVTVHRAENTSDPKRLMEISKALMSLGREFEVVFPIHPRTRGALASIGQLEELRGKVRLIKPVGYLDFIKLLMSADKVITDSGGVQREAYILKVPSIVLRDRTEWVELVKSGWVRLIRGGAEEIVRAVKEMTPPSDERGLLGDGRASERIINIVEELVHEERPADND